MKYTIIARTTIIITIVFSIIGCKKLVTVDGPTTSLNSANVFEKDVTAAAVLTGVYTILSSESVQGTSLSGICYFTGLSSDELSLTENGLNNTLMVTFYANSLNAMTGGGEFWNNIYTKLYVINLAIEGLSNSNTLTPVVKQQLLGEAKFMRAYYYFYLVNLYGDVPLVLTTDYKANSLVSRTAKSKVWEQIIIDLKDSQNLLSADYLDASLLNHTTERVRPTQAAATTLLARAYLYTEKWQLAEEEASKIINNPNFELVALDKVFLKNSREAIWQLQPVIINENTQEALAFIIEKAFVNINTGPAELSESLLSKFEPGDKRKDNWTNSSTIDGIYYTYAYKYKKVNLFNDPNFPVEEYSTILRLAELYLIRGEARIQMERITEGLKDLNVLRDRATDINSPENLRLKNLPNNLSKEAALLAVEHERQIELFTEGGHRWLDLKRSGRIDVIMKDEVPKKLTNANWKTDQQWYPISADQILQNSRLTQNKGY